MPFASLLLPPAALAFVANAALLYLLLRTGLAWRLALDVPNARSLHQRPTPRVGGVGVTLVSAISIAVFAPALSTLAGLALALGMLSLADDRWGMPARYRFAAHLGAAATLLWLLPLPSALWLLAPVLAIAVVWAVNLYNFMDGADGLAGGMAVIGFGAYAVCAGPAHADLAVASITVAAAAAGFLVFNYPPARMFLGDAGSVPLGFLAAALGYWGWQEQAWPFWFPAFVFGPFVADATVTLLRRLLNGERFWEAHRTHYYQRMVQMSAGHRSVVLRWYVLMLVGTILAVMSVDMPGWKAGAVMVTWGLLLIGLGLTIDRRWRQFKSG